MVIRNPCPLILIYEEITAWQAASFYKLYNDDGYTTKPVLEDGLTTITLEVKDGKATAAGDGLTVDAGKVLVQ